MNCYENEGVGEEATTTACFPLAAKNPVTTAPYVALAQIATLTAGKTVTTGFLLWLHSVAGFWAACKVYPLCGNSF